MNRRRFIKAVGASSSIGALAGCSSEDYGYRQCYGDCEKVENVNIDSEDGWKTYTDVVVSFNERFTGSVAVKTYDATDDVNGVREAEVDDVIGYTAHFDTYKTDFQYKVFLEEDG